MTVSTRAKNIPESITLKLNTLAGKLKDEGVDVFNLTAGQLPCAPPESFIDEIYKHAKETISFQYSPVKGTASLREKFTDYLEKTRDISVQDTHDAFIGNGGKNVLTNIIAATVEPRDEVIIFSPYWISYPQMVSFYGGIPITVNEGNEKFVPSLSELEEKISAKTKLIILNSPSNPSGMYLSDQWMEEFAKIIKKHPNVLVISDEIYYEITHDGKKPQYFYHYDKELLKQTFIVHGISKSLACTGLRIGWCLGPKDYVAAISRLQGHTASGANSLTQAALNDYDFFETNEFLKPMLKILNENKKILKTALTHKKLEHLWYEVNSAFYFMLNLKKLPHYKLNYTNSIDDHSFEMCKDLMEATGVVIVPSTDFGILNHARISMVLSPDRFQLAVDKIFDYFA